MCATMEKLRICESGIMLWVLAGFEGWSMVTEHSEAINTQDDFEDGIQRLGWLSAYSQQVLISRYLLRNLATIDDDTHVPYEIP